MMDLRGIKLEKWVDQAVQMAEEAGKSPLGQSLREQVEKSLMAAAALSQNLPSQEQIAQMIEERSPELAQTFVSYASEINSPHQLGMGMKVLSLSDEGARVQMPNRWRNRSQGGTMHSGALMTLAEFTGRTFWERLVDDHAGRVRLLEAKVDFHQATFRHVMAQFHLVGEERERLLFELRQSGEVRTESSIVVFGKGEQRVADFSLLWEITSPMAVAAPSGDTTDADTENETEEEA